jgi:fluoroacetyl-CoA thioesterase
MKPTLHQGLASSAVFPVTAELTVPAFAAQFPRYAGLPPALSTLALIGLVEQACVDVLAPHLEEDEFSVASDVELTHTVATPAGTTLTVDLQVLQVEPRSVLFAVTVSDPESIVSIGQHRRSILDRARYEARLKDKAERLS